MEEVIQHLENKNNVFLTGGAGYGKSYIIKKIKEKYSHAVLTAPTGISANNIDGVTLYHFMGMGLFTISVEEAYKKVLFNNKIKQRLINLKLLIIDECSMLNAEFFEKVSGLLQKIKKNTKAMGGVITIICGDFHQLPPVNSSYIFETETWKKLDLKTIILTKPFRQKDLKFVEMLDRIRVGKPLDEDIKLLKTRVGLKCDDSITRFYPNKSTAQGRNDTMLNLIKEELKSFKCRFWSDKKDNYLEEKYKKYFFESCLAEPVIDLKVGCKVLYLVNNPDMKIYNGSGGIITKFENERPFVKFDNGQEHLIQTHTWKTGNEREEGFFYYEQIPLILGWSLSIHKSQSMTLDSLVTSVSKKIFACGQAYVALSRVREWNGLYLEALDKDAFFADPKVIEFYEKLKSN